MDLGSGKVIFILEMWTFYAISSQTHFSDPHLPARLGLAKNIFFAHLDTSCIFQQAYFRELNPTPEMAVVKCVFCAEAHGIFAMYLYIGDCTNL